MRYGNTSDDWMLTAHHSLIHWYRNDVNNNLLQHQYAVFGWLNKTYTYACLPIERHITEYNAPDDSLTVSTYLRYNRQKMLACDSTVSSRNGIVTTHYRYVGDDTAGQYAWMRQHHFLSAKTSVRHTSDGQTQTDSITYALKQSTNTIPYISKVTTTIDNGPEQTRYEVLETDDYANPVRLVENGVPSYLQWSEEGQRLFLRKTGTHDSNAALQDVPYSYYLYDSSLRLKMAQEPSQPAKYYLYDAYGRLIEVDYQRHEGGLVLPEYEGVIPKQTYQYEFRKIQP